MDIKPEYYHCPCCGESVYVLTFSESILERLESVRRGLGDLPNETEIYTLHRDPVTGNGILTCFAYTLEIGSDEKYSSLFLRTKSQGGMKNKYTKTVFHSAPSRFGMFHGSYINVSFESQNLLRNLEDNLCVMDYFEGRQYFSEAKFRSSVLDTVYRFHNV